MTDSIVLPFAECQAVGIIQYVPFSGLLPWLSNVSLSFLHLFSWLGSSFFLVLWSILLFVCITLYFSKHILKDMKWSESRSVTSDSLQLHGLYSPWNSSGQNTGVGSHFLHQGLFPTQGSNPDLLHCRQILYQLSYKGSLVYTKYGTNQYNIVK